MGSRISAARRNGFTLIELLLVIGIIAILATIVIVAINPTKQLGDARDTKRRNDVNTVLNAVYQYAIDNNGTMPGPLPEGDAADALEICASPCTATGGYVDLDALTGSYLTTIPADPQGGSGTLGTNYWIYQDDRGRVTVSAPGAEGDGVTISVTR
jgi:type IV pilus assembly protein PilA